MKGLSIIKDETIGKRYVQIDLSTLDKIRKSVKTREEFLEELEDIIDVERSKGEKGKPWEEIKAQLQKENLLSGDV